jgi:hypothetical protein
MIERFYYQSIYSCICKTNQISWQGWMDSDQTLLSVEENAILEDDYNTNSQEMAQR